MCSWIKSICNIWKSRAFFSLHPPPFKKNARGYNRRQKQNKTKYWCNQNKPAESTPQRLRAAPLPARQQEREPKGGSVAPVAVHWGGQCVFQGRAQSCGVTAATCGKSNFLSAKPIKIRRSFLPPLPFILTFKLPALDYVQISRPNE